MKKLLAVILPSLSTFIPVILDFIFPYSKYIVFGIYILFPLIYIIQGIVTSNSMKSTLTGMLLSSLIIMITTSIWYNMGSLTIPVIIYSMLGLITSFIVGRIKGNEKL